MKKEYMVKETFKGNGDVFLKINGVEETPLFKIGDAELVSSEYRVEQHSLIDYGTTNGVQNIINLITNTYCYISIKHFIFDNLFKILGEYDRKCLDLTEDEKKKLFERVFNPIHEYTILFPFELLNTVNSNIERFGTVKFYRVKLALTYDRLMYDDDPLVLRCFLSPINFKTKNLNFENYRLTIFDV